MQHRRNLCRGILHIDSILLGVAVRCIGCANIMFGLTREDRRRPLNAADSAADGRTQVAGFFLGYIGATSANRDASFPRLQGKVGQDSADKTLLR